MTNIALCIPTLGAPTWAMFDSFGKWQSYHYQVHPDIAAMVIRPPRALPVDVARTYLAQQVVNGDYDYLWFTDQDASYLPTTLERLMAWDVPIVGALCMMRMPTFCTPMLFRGRKAPDSEFYKIPANEVYMFLREYADVETNGPQAIDPVPEDSLFEVDFTGCHCLLIKREVLLATEPPWFYGKPGQEDRHFCFKVRDAGYPIYVDFSTIVGHAAAEHVIGAYDFMSHFLYQNALEGADIGLETREDGREEAQPEAELV